MPELATIFARNRANSADFARYCRNSGEFTFAFRAISRVFAFLFWSRFWSFFVSFRCFFIYLIVCNDCQKRTTFPRFSRFFAFRFWFLGQKSAKISEIFSFLFFIEFLIFSNYFLSLLFIYNIKLHFFNAIDLFFINCITLYWFSLYNVKNRIKSSLKFGSCSYIRIDYWID